MNIYRVYAQGKKPGQKNFGLISSVLVEAINPIRAINEVASKLSDEAETVYDGVASVVFLTILIERNITMKQYQEAQG